MFKPIQINQFIKDRIKQFIASKASKGLLFQTSLSFAMRCVSVLIAFGFNLVIARKLPIKEAGLFFLALSFVEILLMVALFGFQQTQVRFISSFKAENNWKGINGIYKTSRSLVFISGCVLALLLFALSSFIASRLLNKPELETVLQFLAPSILLAALMRLNGFSFQALGHVGKFIFFSNCFLQLCLSLILLFNLSNSAIETAKYYSISSFVGFLIVTTLWFTNKNTQWLGVKHYSISTLWQSCFPLWVASLVGLAINYSGQLISGVLLSSKEVAIYTTALKTALLISFILGTINLVIVPKFAALYKQKQYQQLKHTALKSTKIMLLFALPVTLFMLVFAEYLMWLFGAQYKEGANLLRILIVGQFINVATGSVGGLLAMTGHEKDIRNLVFINGPIAIGLAATLIPLFGLTGAAISTALALSLQNLLAVRMVKKRLGFSMFSVWWRA